MRLRGDQIEVFKILNWHMYVFFHSRKIGYQDIRKFSFSQRTINEWNKLSTDCITAEMNMFKNKIDTYLRRADYT